MKYTVTGVSKVVTDVNGQYGPSKRYMVDFEEYDDEVAILQKSSTPAPTIGDELYGSVETNSYGAYFKKDRRDTPYQPAFRKVKEQLDKFPPPRSDYTMYVSYVKDLMIAYMNSVSWDFTKLDEVAFNLMMQNIGDAAKVLRESENT